MNETHSHFQICPSLTPKEKCVRIRKYKEGQFQEIFHEHVPARRLAQAATSELLWTLVLRYEEAAARQIVQSYLSRRGYQAKADHPLQVRVEYPEPGVMRSYCGGNVLAWIDTVVNSTDFRRSASEGNAPVLRTSRRLHDSHEAPPRPDSELIPPMRRHSSQAKTPSCDEILARLRPLGCRSDVEGMARFGIRPDKALGIRAPVLKKIAREIGRNHQLALELWATGIHEARHLAVYIEEPARVTEAQAERWVHDLDSWDTCDGLCLYLLVYLPFAWRKVFEWSRREREFEKRAAFSLIAVLSVHDKKTPKEKFLRFLPVIKRAATDERNFVKKAVNWALRQIGKQNLKLNHAAIRTAEEIRRLDSRAARWNAADALRELESDAVQKRLRGRRR